MRSLLAATWSSFIQGYIKDEAQANILAKAFEIIEIVLWVVMAIVGALGAIYAIYLGVQLARAEDQGKRDDAKKHLITVCIAVGVTIALVVVFNVAVPSIADAFIDRTPPPQDDKKTTMLQPVLDILRAFR